MPGEGLAEATGAGIPIRLFGRDLVLEPLGLEDFGVIENEMRAKLPNLLRQVAECHDVLPKDVFNEKWSEAIAEARRLHRIPPDDVLAYTRNDIDGVSLAFWICLEKRYKGQFSRAEILKELERLAINNSEEYQDLLARHDMVSGLSPEGNSSGLTQSPHHATTANAPTSQTSSMQSGWHTASSREGDDRPASAA